MTREEYYNRGKKYDMKARKRLNHIWNSMKRRCYNETDINYKNYGAKGICICDEWMVFDNFYEWSMNNGYKEELSIDRINGNKNYSPDNCRWATQYEQSNNRRNNHLLTYNGKTQTIRQWSDETGIEWYTINNRLMRGWSIERTLTEEPKRKRVG